MATITSLGTGSGLDLEGLVTQLVASTRAPVENRLNFREAGLQSELSAFGALKGALSTFQDAIKDLASNTGFQARSSSSSNKDAFTVTATDTASTGNFNVNVTGLSAAHTLATPADDANYSFSSPNAVVGTGTLTFKFGTTAFTESPFAYTFTQNADKATQSITIDSTNNTLEGVKDAINDANIGVSASIVKDGDEYRLAFVSADTGAANSLQITVDDSGDTIDTDQSGLSRLAFHGNGANDYTHLKQTAAAADAALTINGIAISSASDTIADVIDGVTIDLVAVGTGTLSVSQDQSAATKAVDGFISAYNELIDTVNSLSSYDAENQQAGILLGDTTLRNITDQLRNVLRDPVEGLGGAYDSLANAGITTDANGKLVKDSTKFQKVLDNNFDSVAKLFSAIGTPTDNLIKFDSSTDASKIGTHAVNITTLATQGKYTGGAAVTGAPSSIVITAGSNDTFSVKVDGIQSATMTLTAGTYSGADLAKELQSRINGDSAMINNDVSVSVAFDAATNKLAVTSNRFGSASKIENITGTSIATLGLDSSDAGNSGDGVDVAGTIGGFAATGSGRFLTGIGDTSGIKIEVTGGSTGDRGDLVFSRGYADQLNSALTEILQTNDLIKLRTDGLDDRIEDINEQREALERRLIAQEQRLRSQFTALDTLVGQLNSTSSFLTQQLSSLQTSFKPNSN